MNQPELLTHPAHCRCGATAFAVTGEPLVTLACHCTGCRRMTASAFSLTAIFPCDRFEVTKGAPVLGGLRDAVGHHHCPDCKSWLYTAPQGWDFVNVRSTMFEPAAFTTPFVETFTSEKLPWVTTPAVHSFERFPDEAEFPRLMAAYAAAHPS